MALQKGALLACQRQLAGFDLQRTGAGDVGQPGLAGLVQTAIHQKAFVAGGLGGPEARFGSVAQLAGLFAQGRDVRGLIGAAGGAAGLRRGDEQQACGEQDGCAAGTLEGKSRAV